MIVIGLTGGIGSGKSTAANLFAELGVPIIDSDLLAREVLTTQKTLSDKIITHFGSTVLDSSNQLDRTKLRELIFNNTQERHWLEQLLHPPIIQELKQKIAHLKERSISYCIVVIPLLAETPAAQALVDRILTVDVAEEMQLVRTGERDGLTEEEIKKILTSQATRAQRLNLADEVIHNEKNIDALREQVFDLHQTYLKLAAEKT